MGFQSDHVLDFCCYTVRIGTWQIDFINNWENIQIMIQSQVHVSQCLGLDSLCCVHHQDCAVAGCQASGHLIVKVHMSWGINQVENILFSIFRLIYGSDRLGLDGDSSLPLQIHVIQHLILHLTAGQKSCFLYDSVCKG